MAVIICMFIFLYFCLYMYGYVHQCFPVLLFSILYILCSIDKKTIPKTTQTLACLIFIFSFSKYFSQLLHQLYICVLRTGNPSNIHVIQVCSLRKFHKSKLLCSFQMKFIRKGNFSYFNFAWNLKHENIFLLRVNESIWLNLYSTNALNNWRWNDNPRNNHFRP